jgi:alkanesulfonate monooxygenase SsuD/methylene tetrahydromethanopterin reductase-like flavin-dependent oxidoreductase (luciferase family)
MKFGVHLPNSGGGAVYPDSLAEFGIIRDIALASEEFGFNSVWVNEHVTSPTDQTPTSSKFYEPITLLSSLASITSKISLGTAIVILPFRDPFIISKEIGTLAELSGNRFVFGVGPGRFEREYIAQGKNWTDRLRILDEQIRLIRALTSGKNVDFEGRYYSCKDFSIRPAFNGISIVLGGSGPHALKRAARICDGIMPGHITVAEAKSIHDSVSEEVSRSKSENSHADTFAFYSEIIVSIDVDREKARSKFLANSYVKKVPYATDLSNKALIGTPQDILEKIAEYERAGVDELVMIFADETRVDFLNSMKLFSTRVIA